MRRTPQTLEGRSGPWAASAVSMGTGDACRALPAAASGSRLLVDDAARAAGGIGRAEAFGPGSRSIGDGEADGGFSGLRGGFFPTGR